MTDQIKPVGKNLEKKILNLIKNNQLQIRSGANEVTKMVNRSKSLLVMIAADTQPIHIVGHLPIICNDKDVPFVYLENGESMGNATGLGRKITSCCVVYDDDRSYERVKKDVGRIIAEMNGITPIN